MANTCEIVEAKEGFNAESRTSRIVKEESRGKQARVYSIDDDINQLFNSVSINTSVKAAEAVRRNPMKRPIRANSLRTQGFGITESVNLKQALRGLCISQASEMAAMKKKSLKQATPSGIFNVEISLMGKIMANLTPESSEGTVIEMGMKVARAPSKDKVVPLPQGSADEKSGTNSVLGCNNLQRIRSLNGVQTLKNADLVVTKQDSNKVKSTRSISPLRMYQFRRNLTKRRVKTELDPPSTSSEPVNKAIDTKNSDVLTSCKPDERSRAVDKPDKVDFSQSSKGSSSIGEYTCSTSEESSVSGSSRSCNRPHMSKDTRWESVHTLQKRLGFLSLRHFKLLKRLGSGDIGTVYLAELVGTKCLFALKVMDNEFLARRKKLVRAQMEREILQMLDHPFLPTLYAHFTTDKLSCLVMEYCPGGDLHVIRQRQPSRCFSEQAARFYVAEVLLALEYLHMLGIIYRDLKPENILVREDGHIMLSDFDLSLRSVVNPTLLTSTSPVPGPTNTRSSTLCSESSCIDPFCLQPSFQLSCFTPRLLTSSSTAHKHRPGLAPQLVAEPTDARSNSFVGTHEYLAPEIIRGDGHGSAVDWWTYGVFLYELLYGRTPFKGGSNEETLANVVSEPLKFPGTPLVSFHAKDLVRGLLVKRPENRLGFSKGAAEIKQHPFFEGLNWALIRCAVPPERPRVRDVGHELSSSSRKDIDFELF